MGKESFKLVEGKKDDLVYLVIYLMGEFLKFGELIKDEGNFYDFIVRCFLVFFMELVVREIMKVVINFNNYCFILSGVRIFKEGWLKVYGKYVKFDEVIFLVFKEGEFVKVI